MPPAALTPDSVMKIFQSLSPHKTPGPDERHSKIMRAPTPFIAEHLTLLFNLSFFTTEVLEYWRIAIICPILKKGSGGNGKLSSCPVGGHGLQSNGVSHEGGRNEPLTRECRFIQHAAWCCTQKVLSYKPSSHIALHNASNRCAIIGGRSVSRLFIGV